MVLAYLGDSVPEDELLALFDGTEFGTLELGLPSIALVHTAFLDYWTESARHAVVVVGLDEKHAYLNDPAFESAPQTVSLDGFLTAWIEMDQISATITR